MKDDAGPAEVVLHPEVARLRAELARASERLMELLLQIDDIELQQNPSIEADYAVKVGYLENELLSRQIAARRARRALSLAQAVANRGGALDAQALARIEQQLDEELAVWKAKLQAAIDRASALLRRRAEGVPLSSAEARELKRLYRKLMKRLHPDMNPDVGDDEREYFLIAQHLYSNGDLAGLRALLYTVETSFGPGDTGLHIDVLDSLESELKATNLRVTSAQKRLDDFKASFPYAYKDLLLDSAWVRKQSDALQGSIREAREAEDEYAHRLDELKRGDA